MSKKVSSYLQKWSSVFVSHWLLLLQLKCNTAVKCPLGLSPIFSFHNVRWVPSEIIKINYFYDAEVVFFVFLFCSINVWTKAVEINNQIFVWTNLFWKLFKSGFWSLVSVFGCFWCLFVFFFYVFFFVYLLC